VIELLKGEKDLNTLATENNIQPNNASAYYEPSYVIARAYQNGGF
jgi:hypothetical protein